MPSIDVPWGAEIVWAVLTPKKVTNSSKIKKLIVASFYSKPSSRKKTLLLDHISQVYHSMLARYKDGVYFIICGDRNELKMDAILNLNQHFKLIHKTDIFQHQLKDEISLYKKL